MNVVKVTIILAIIGMNVAVQAGLSKEVAQLMEQVKNDHDKLATLQVISWLIQDGRKEDARVELKKILQPTSASSSRSESPVASFSGSDEVAEFSYESDGDEWATITAGPCFWTDEEIIEQFGKLSFDQVAQRAKQSADVKQKKRGKKLDNSFHVHNNSPADSDHIDQP